MGKQTSGIDQIAGIDVGDGPSAIGIASLYHPAADKRREIAYVANTFSNSVSVISADNNTEIGKIAVGDEPSAIGIADGADTVNVANTGSDTVSVIDGTTNRVVAGVTFQVNPFNSGYIVCTDLSTPSDKVVPSPMGQYMYVYSGSQCTARPNEGFEFSSWEENLQANSTQPIQVSRSDSPWDSFVLAVTDFFSDKPDKPEAKLNITRFGTFTANFREAPPPLPQEFWAQMYAVIATVITALFIPSIVGWFRSKRDIEKLYYYHNQIASLYGDGKLHENDIGALDRLQNSIGNAYSEGKINEKHYENLKNEISVCYEKILRKRIYDVLNDGSQKGNTEKQLNKIKSELENAYSEGKINEKHYDLLSKAISKPDSKENDNTA